MVNVFTTGSNVGGNASTTAQSSNQIPTLQRIKTLPQTVVSAHNNFILPTSIASTSLAGSTTTTTSLPQLILQSQQQHQQNQQLIQQNPQQQHHQQHQQTHVNHQTLTTQRIPNNLNTNSLPLQLQQQLKQNIITVHAIHTQPTSNTSPASAPTLTPTSSPAPSSANLTLPPLITTTNMNPHTTLELNDSNDHNRNNFTNIIVSSSTTAPSTDNITSSTSSSCITSIPLTATLGGTVVNTQQNLNRKLNSPNF